MGRKKKNVKASIMKEDSTPRRIFAEGRLLLMFAYIWSKNQSLELNGLMSEVLASVEEDDLVKVVDDFFKLVKNLDKIEKGFILQVYTVLEAVLSDNKDIARAVEVVYYMEIYILNYFIHFVNTTNLTSDELESEIKVCNLLDVAWDFLSKEFIIPNVPRADFLSIVNNSPFRVSLFSNHPCIPKINLKNAPLNTKSNACNKKSKEVKNSSKSAKNSDTLDDKTKAARESVKGYIKLITAELKESKQTHWIKKESDYQTKISKTNEKIRQWKDIARSINEFEEPKINDHCNKLEEETVDSSPSLRLDEVGRLRTFNRDCRHAQWGRYGTYPISPFATKSEQEERIEQLVARFDKNNYLTHSEILEIHALRAHLANKDATACLSISFKGLSDREKNIIEESRSHENPRLGLSLYRIESNFPEILFYKLQEKLLPVTTSLIQIDKYVYSPLLLKWIDSFQFIIDFHSSKNKGFKSMNDKITEIYNQTDIRNGAKNNFACYNEYTSFGKYYQANSASRRKIQEVGIFLSSDRYTESEIRSHISIGCNVKPTEYECYFNYMCPLAFMLCRTNKDSENWGAHMMSFISSYILMTKQIFCRLFLETLGFPMTKIVLKKKPIDMSKNPYYKQSSQVQNHFKKEAEQFSKEKLKNGNGLDAQCSSSVNKDWWEAKRKELTKQKFPYNSAVWKDSYSYHDEDVLVRLSIPNPPIFSFIYRLFENPRYYGIRHMVSQLVDSKLLLIKH